MLGRSRGTQGGISAHCACRTGVNGQSGLFFTVTRMAGTRYSKRRFTEESKFFPEIRTSSIVQQNVVAIWPGGRSTQGRIWARCSRSCRGNWNTPFGNEVSAEDKRTWLRALSSLEAPLFLCHPDGLNMHTQQKDLMCSIDDPIGCSCVF